MKEINYIIGDATEPKTSDIKFIVHCCNDIGAWGAGFVLALSKKWEKPEKSYKEWYKNTKELNMNDGSSLKLGAIQILRVQEDIFVVNLIGQKGIGIKNGIPPIDYKAIRTGLSTLLLILDDTFENHDEFSIHMPRIGCGLAGGDWNKIEEIIKNTLCCYDTNVNVYDLPKSNIKKTIF